MPNARTLRSYLAELVVIFVGVVLAFAVDNHREARNDRAVGDEYLSAFRQDRTADLQMLQNQLSARQAQLRNARTVLEFFEGRPNDPAIFFEAYWPVLWNLRTIPNRNTTIALFEDHIARDFDMYLYDPTFSSLPIQFKGPWKDTPASRESVETLLGDRRVENGLRLIVVNLDNVAVPSDTRKMIARMSPAREYEQCRALIAAEWYQGVRIRRCDRLVGALFTRTPATPRRGHPRAVAAVGRKHPVETGQMDSRFRHQCRQPGDEVQPAGLRRRRIRVSPRRQGAGLGLPFPRVQFARQELHSDAPGGAFLSSFSI